MITVLYGGILTTIQDLGRYGWQKYGVSVGGAMDTLSHRIANILVGNAENEGTLEMTLQGPILQFHKSALIAICGGKFCSFVNNKPIPNWQPIYIEENSQLKIGNCCQGVRGYLAIYGGIDLPEILSSKSTLLSIKLGGLNGKPLYKGDVLNWKKPNDLNKKLFTYFANNSCNWQVSSQLNPAFNLKKTMIIYAMHGEHYQISIPPKKIIDNYEFVITTMSNRMGYQLNTSGLLGGQHTLPSDTVTCGTVQMTSSTNAILLMADRQTSGGYPKIIQVITTELPKLAQCPIGTSIVFKTISLPIAEQKLLLQAKWLTQLKLAIKHHYLYLP